MVMCNNNAAANRCCCAALVNGGRLITPTLFRASQAQADAEAVQVISAKTSKNMRDLMRMNVEKGSGKRAEVPGFRVGGKTGTAEKVVNGRYSSKVRFNAFLATSQLMTLNMWF